MAKKNKPIKEIIKNLNANKYPKVCKKCSNSGRLCACLEKDKK